MKISIIVNSSSGTIKGSTLTVDDIKKAFVNFNVDAEIFEVPGKKLTEKAAELIKTNIDAIVAAGGDGTVSAVAEACAGNKIPFGVLPLGTLNHFAKDLNIPLELEQAAEVISKMKLQKIDTGEVNGKIFINNSSIGFYPRLVKYREMHQKINGNKWFSMVKAFFGVMIRFPVIRVKIVSEENKIHCRTPFVFIGNNEYEMDIFNLGSRKNITGGALSLYYPVVTNRWKMFYFFFMALFNKLNQEKDFRIETITGLTIETKKKIIEVSTDGEVFHLQTPLNYKIRPLDLTVIVP